jgi:hypothetical protein
LAGGTVLSTAGCLSLDYRAEFDACGHATGTPCSESDVPENVTEIGSVIDSNETDFGRVIDAASYRVPDDQTLVIHGIASGNGDPNCHRIRLLQIRRDRDELGVTILSDHGDREFNQGCRQPMALVPYRVKIPVALGSLSSIRVRHLTGEFGMGNGIDPEPEFEASVSL